jgi:hypothetical protein
MSQMLCTLNAYHSLEQIVEFEGVFEVVFLAFSMLRRVQTNASPNASDTKP